MSCPEQTPLIESYFDEELDLIRSLEIEKHIVSCASCADHLKHLQGLRSTIHAARLNESAPPKLRDWTVDAVIASEAKQSVRPVDNNRSPRVAKRLATLAMTSLVAAFAFILVGLYAVPRRAEYKEADEIVSAHVRSLMAAHLTDVTSTDQHTVKPWFNGKLDFAPWVHDLAEYDFPLKGGRLEYLAHRPTAALVYQRHQHFINLFLWPENHDHSPSSLTVRGYHLIHWTKSGMTYWAISDLNNQELEQFAQLVQNQTLFP